MGNRSEPVRNQSGTTSARGPDTSPNRSLFRTGRTGSHQAGDETDTSPVPDRTASGPFAARVVRIEVAFGPVEVLEEGRPVTRLTCPECGNEVLIGVVVSAAWCGRCGVELVEAVSPPRARESA